MPNGSAINRDREIARVSTLDRWLPETHLDVRGIRGLAMRNITIRVRAVDFAEQMAAMRTWLDEHRFEPSRFKYSEDDNDILIDVSFKAAVEAAAFSARFNGRGTQASSTTATVERDVSIGEAGDVSSDDLGSQLPNSHC
jgi:hypothetical protein